MTDLDKTDLDTMLRSLSEDLRVDPIVSAAEIRRLGERRRGRRFGAVLGSTVAAVAAVGVALSLGGGRSAAPPADPNPATSTSSLPGVPPWITLANEDPRVYVLAGPVDTGPAVTAEAGVGADGGCVVLRPAAGRTGPEAKPRALVFPAGSTWLPAGDDGVVRLADGRLIEMGARVTATVVVSERTDTTFTSACPGSAGWATLLTPDAVASIRLPSGPPPSSTGSPSTRPVGWVTTISDDFPLAQGLVSNGDETLTEATRDLGAWGLLPCLTVDDTTSRDALESALVGPADQHVRQLRVYADDSAAGAALTAWIAAAERCRGYVAEGTPALTLDFTVTEIELDTILIVQATHDSGGQLYPWGGWVLVHRVGNALLTISESSEGMTTAANAAAWREEAEALVTTFTPDLCGYAEDGC